MDFDSQFECSSYNWNHNEPQSWEEWEECEKMQETATGIADSVETNDFIFEMVA